VKCYYHNDLDGRCAAAIVYKEHYWCEMIEVDYKDEIDVEAIRNERVYIVDFSFKPETMEGVLKKTKDIVWIDHHKTAFEYDYGIELKGVRNDGYAGCELTWMYLYPDEEMPRAVELIGDRDKWAWKYGDETRHFNMGMSFYDCDPKNKKLWIAVLDRRGNLEDIKAKGKICLQYRDRFCADYRKSYGWETIFENRNCYALGIYMFGSEVFGEKMKEYDICLSYEYLGDKWIVGLYSENVDVSVIAKKYGGGGHRGAAGFTADKLPFKRRNIMVDGSKSITMTLDEAQKLLGLIYHEVGGRIVSSEKYEQWQGAGYLKAFDQLKGMVKEMEEREE
jgi:oligoribonuclease NrnB/cAMP/cGMP phosphodiesterase (DHH superfamily)